MSTIALNDNSGMFDPEKGFYGAGEIVMAAQEMIVLEEAAMVVGLAETIINEAVELKARQALEVASKPTASMLEIGVAVVGSIVAVSLLESLLGKSKD